MTDSKKGQVSISKAVTLNIAKEVLNTLLARKDVDPKDPTTTDIAVAHATGLVKNIADAPDQNH